MYLDYFGFTEPPFSIAPDPRFLYMSERHREAFAHLLYGLQNEGGFVLLTGEVGTGKTTVCRCLLEKIPADTNLAFVLNPKVTVPELLATICDEFGIRYPEGNTSNKVFIDRINEFLLQSNAEGRRSVLIIDEAQNLDTDVLEQVRLLTNLETNQRKLLQIIVLGQPELQEKLGRPELRQLAQRITARYHLGPLSRGEMEAYVTHRLQVAGIRGKDPLFFGECFPLLFQLTNGIPRLINLLCDRALLGAYGQNAAQVDPAVLRQAAREVLGQGGGKAWRVEGMSRRRRFLSGGAVAALLLTAVFVGGIFEKGGSLFSPEPPPGAADKAAATAVEEGNKVGGIGENADALVASLAVSTSYESETPPAAAADWPEGLSAAQSKELAFQTLFKHWGIAFNPDRNAPPCAFAREQGLRCLQRQDSLEALRRFNRPAVLSFMDGKGGEFFATLVSLEGERATFAVGDTTWTADSHSVAQRWSGNYTMLWRPPAGYEDSVRPGHQGPVVEYISGLISRIRGLSPIAGVRLYNSDLVLQVKEFQNSEGLVPDGIVGGQTLILLQTRAGGEAPLLVPASSHRG